jgi:hypothetical protein
MKKRLVTSLFILGLGFQLAAAEPRLVLKAERSEVALGEEIELSLAAILPLGVKADLLPARSDEFLLSAAETVEVTPELIRYRLLLRPLALGKLEIAPFQLALTGPGDRRDVLTSEGLSLTVTGRLPVDAQLGIDDIRQPGRVAYPPGVWAWPLALLAGIALVLFLWRRRGFQEERVLSLAIETPAAGARRELASLRKWRTDDAEALREYYSRMSLALRRYLGRRYDFMALGSTSSEIRARLAETTGGLVGPELERLLSGSDLVKYANHAFGPLEAKADLALAFKVVADTSGEASPNTPERESVVGGSA